MWILMQAFKVTTAETGVPQTSDAILTSGRLKMQKAVLWTRTLWSLPDPSLFCKDPDPPINKQNKYEKP